MCQKRREKRAGYEALSESDSSFGTETTDESSAQHHEPFANAANVARTVQVESLKKSYGKSEILKGISFSMYEKQIFW